MNVTSTAVRRNISVLQQQELIVSRADNHDAGRPTYKYRLTESAVTQFPSGYEKLAASLLDAVFENGGHVAVMDILKLNNDLLIEKLLPRFKSKNLAGRVEELAHYFAENGYMSDWMKLPDGNFFLYHQNCAVYKLAVLYRQLCILEPRLMESLLGVKVSRQQYILKNQPICGYLVDRQRPLSS